MVGQHPYQHYSSTPPWHCIGNPDGLGRSHANELAPQIGEEHEHEHEAGSSNGAVGMGSTGQHRLRRPVGDGSFAPRDASPGRVRYGSPSWSRPSGNRDALVRLLGQCDEFFSVAELQRSLADSNVKISKVTVYRIIEVLKESGDLDISLGESGETRYRLRRTRDSSTPAICGICNRVTEVRTDVLDDWAHRTAADHGFVAPVIRVQITGVCSRCARRETE